MKFHCREATNWSGLPFSRPTPSLTPALFTRALIRPNFLRVCSTVLEQASGAARSATIKSLTLPCCRKSGCDFSTASGSRSTITGMAPSPATIRVMAAPMPLAPPVTITTLSFSWRSMLLVAEIEKASVYRVVHSGDEGCFIGAQKKSKGGDLVRLPHPADRLRGGELCEHFLFLACVIAIKIAIDERRVNSRRRDAITADVILQIILRYRIRHRDNGTFAHRVSETVHEP